VNRLLGRGVLVRGAVILALLLVALRAARGFDTSWIDTFTSVAICRRLGGSRRSTAGG
jgi:hypothetical protein